MSVALLSYEHFSITGTVAATLVYCMCVTVSCTYVGRWNRYWESDLIPVVVSKASSLTGEQDSDGLLA